MYVTTGETRDLNVEVDTVYDRTWMIDSQVMIGKAAGIIFASKISLDSDSKHRRALSSSSPDPNSCRRYNSKPGFGQGAMQRIDMCYESFIVSENMAPHSDCSYTASFPKVVLRERGIVGTLLQQAPPSSLLLLKLPMFAYIELHE